MVYPIFSPQIVLGAGTCRSSGLVSGRESSVATPHMQNESESSATSKRIPFRESHSRRWGLDANREIKVAGYLQRSMNRRLDFHRVHNVWTCFKQLETYDNPCGPCVYPSICGLLQHSMLAIVQQVLLLSVWVERWAWDPGTLGPWDAQCDGHFVLVSWRCGRNFHPALFCSLV